MNKIKKLGIVALSVVTVVSMSGVQTSNAQTVAELQAQIQALLAQLQALQSQTGSTTGSGVAVSCDFTRNLYPGDSGPQVECLQRYLNAAGYTVADSGVGSPGNETEYYGGLTQAAVKEWQDAQGLSYGQWGGYFGPSSRSKYNELKASAPVVTPGDSDDDDVVVPDDGIKITLSSNNPEATEVPDNASAVEYLRFDVAGDGDVDSLTFERTGLGSTNDFGSVYLYEGNSRLTSGKSINSTTHQIYFPNLGIDVNDEVKTYRLVADMSSATAGDRNAFDLVEATGDDSIEGLPLKGNRMEVVGTSVGSLTVSTGSSPSNPTVGASDAKLAEFKLTAGSSEDVLVSKIALTEGGTVNNSYITDLELRVGSKVVATADAVEGSRELATFIFDEPYEIEKGQVKTFKVYGSVSGQARSDDTIIFYFDSAGDIVGEGQTYGYNVSSTITSMDTTSEADTLTLQGGQVTVTINGPQAEDVALRAQDVTLLDFNIAAQTDIEIQNLRFGSETTGMTSGEGFNDMKVWDADTNQVLTSAVDIATTTTETVYTDTITIDAGESRHFKVTADIDADNDTNDSITLTLNSFDANDIKNLENNRYVATADIVGDNQAGNAQTVKIPSVDMQLSATPTSDTYVQGNDDVELFGFSLRAVADDVSVTSLKVTASSTTGTLTNSEISNLRLYDSEDNLVGDAQDLSSSLDATFDGFTHVISKGQTEEFTVKGDLSTNATDGDVYFVYVSSLDDLGAEDSDGNSLTSGTSGITGSTVNSDNTVELTITSTGDVSVAKAPDDSETEAGIVVGNGTQQTLAKFRFTATNEEMTINDFDVLVNNDNTSATATTTAAADEVSTLYLYDGSTLLGSFTVIGSGADSGTVYVRDLGWNVPKNDSKVLTVKGLVNEVQSGASGADTGSEVAVHIQTSNWEAVGAGSGNKDSTLTSGASGNEKFVYKTKPTITIPTQSYTLGAGNVPVFKFQIAADSNEQLAWKKVQFYVSMTGATMSAVEAAPGTTGNVALKDLSSSNNINIATAYSGSATTDAGQAAITGGNAGYVTLILSSEEVVSAGDSKEYELQLPFTDLSTTAGNSYAFIKMYEQETSVVSATWYDGVETATEDGQPSFIWSDYSSTSHATSTGDWANGYYVKTLPSVQKTVSN
jgi:hypothetical protein